MTNILFALNKNKFENIITYTIISIVVAKQCPQENPEGVSKQLIGGSLNLENTIIRQT